MIKNYLKSISFEIVMIIAIGVLMGLMLLNVPNALAAEGPNVILNPSFEILNSGVPANWRPAFWPDTTIAAFDMVDGSGGPSTKAARVKINGYGGEGDAKWYPDDVDVTAGSYYSFSDKYKSDISSRVVIRFNKGVCDTTPGDCTYLEIGNLASSTEWKTFSAGFIPPVGTLSVTIFHFIEGVGELTIDDFSLNQSDNNNPISFEQGMVSLTFDDGWKSIHANALPILENKNFKSTQYLIANTIADTNEGVDGYMSKADVLDFNAKGHEIAAHTFSHPNLIDPSMTESELQKEIAGARYKLLTDLNVRPVNGLAYTYGLYNDRATQAVKEAGFLGARTVDNGFNDKNSNRYLLKSLVIERGGEDVQSGEMADPTSMVEVKAAIDQAFDNKTWLVLTFHQIDNVVENVYGASIEMFQEIIDYIAQKNISVKTMAEALRLMPGVPAAENTAPVISASPDINATTSSTSTIVSFALPTVSDNVDQGLKPYCSSDDGLMSGSFFPLGETLIRCQAMDTSGNVATSTTFRVRVNDVNTSTYTITPTAGLNGNISPSSPSVVASGTSQVYTIIPDVGYKVENVIVDDIPVGATNTYTFSNVNRNHTINASFSLINPGTINISPSTSTISRGNRLQFMVTLPASTTATSTWSSTNANVATVDSVGLATALANGTTTITVTNGTSTASALLTVNDPIATIIISPATSTIPVGATAQFVVTIPGSSTSTATSTWSSTNANVATVNNNGLATALAVGTTTITVTNGTSTASALLTVENPISITITPATSTIAVGATQQFTVNILNGATSTATSTWSSSNLAVANINTNGLATALAVGTTTITVTNGTSTASALLTVTPSINILPISPATSTILVGSSLQFVSNIPTTTATSTWSSSNVNVATIDQNGLANGLAVGTTTISFVNGTSTASTLLTVSDMTLSPATSTILIGATQQFVINMATTSTSTATSTWASSNNNVATVDQNGLATALAIGTTTITATNGTSTASAILTVNPLVTINISPATSTIVVGATQQFTVTMLASTTATSTWSSSNINVATIDSNGLATGKAVGTTTITVTNGTSTASALLTVNAPVVNPPSSGGGSGGGGGGSGIFIPGNIEAINTPLVITSAQAGLIRVSIDNNNKVSLNVPSGAVGSTTTFTIQVIKASAYDAQDLSDNAAIIGEYVYDIVATEPNGSRVTNFTKDLTFTVNAPLPENLNGVGIYYLDTATNRWILITDSSFDQDTNKITFKAKHLSVFAMMRTSSLSSNINILNPGVVIPTSTPTSTKAVLGVKVFVDGTLIRQVGDPRIYVIVKGERQLIRNLEELKRYAGKKIIIVDADGNEVKVNIKKYNNGDLLRTPNGRIYVIVNNKLMRVRTLAELRRNHFRKIINNVGDDVVRGYQLSN